MTALQKFKKQYGGQHDVGSDLSDGDDEYNPCLKSQLTSLMNLLYQGAYPKGTLALNALLTGLGPLMLESVAVDYRKYESSPNYIRNVNQYQSIYYSMPSKY